MNRFLFENERYHTNLESVSAHLGTRAVKHDLNFASIPWILCVYVKPGKHCSAISDVDFKLQLMNFNITLSAIIWGDSKTHFTGISVDANREKHIYYDRMASQQMVILQHDQPLSSIAGFGGLLQLWYVKKAE